MRVLMVVAPRDFRDEELFQPRAILERDGHSVVIASTRAGECRGSRGGSVTAELELAAARSADYDAVVFVGGPGAHVLFDDPDAWRLARELDAARKVVAAICIAPVILARAGVLAGRRATVFPTEEDAIVRAGAELAEVNAVTDGNVITAKGPESAMPFGERIAAGLAQRRAARASATYRAHCSTDDSRA